MSDYRNELIQSVEIQFAQIMSDSMRERAVSALLTVLNEYEVNKTGTAIIPHPMVNETLLNRYCACLMIGGKSTKTIAQYRRTAEKLSDAVQKNYTDIGVYDIRVFLAYEKQRGVSNRTLENTRANLSAFFQWMQQEDIIVKNPCMNIQPIKYTDKVRLPFSQVEIDALRFACKTPKERALVEFLLATGVRVSELANMDVADINFNTLTVHVKHGKGAKERTVYMNDLAKTHLQSYLLNRKMVGPYLFSNKKKERLNAGGIRHILNELGKRAEVENVHPHRFRRTFATGLSSRGMEIQEIQKLLGHSNINTTLEYIYTSDEKVHASYMRYIA